MILFPSRKSRLIESIEILYRHFFFNVFIILSIVYLKSNPSFRVLLIEDSGKRANYLLPVVNDLTKSQK